MSYSLSLSLVFHAHRLTYVRFFLPLNILKGQNNILQNIY